MKTKSKFRRITDILLLAFSSLAFLSESFLLFISYGRLPSDLPGGTGKPYLWYIYGFSVFCFTAILICALRADKLKLPFSLSKSGSAKTAPVLRRCFLLTLLVSSLGFLYTFYAVMFLAAVSFPVYIAILFLFIGIVIYGFWAVFREAVKYGVEDTSELTDEEAEEIIKEFKDSFKK